MDSGYWIEGWKEKKREGGRDEERGCVNKLKRRGLEGREGGRKGVRKGGTEGGRERVREGGRRLYE